MALYEVAYLGSPTADTLSRVRAQLSMAADNFGLMWDRDITFVDGNAGFYPGQKVAAVVLAFGGPALATSSPEHLFDVQHVPVVPVASSASEVAKEIPEQLLALNCLILDRQGVDAIVPAALGCLGLLPRQRRVFLSYRRQDATPAAVQLFAALSARQHEVFLDTHSINVAEDFQESLWHQLCDVDVLLMLETSGYFESRWTVAEYGRALSKGIGVLRVTWPDLTPSIYTGTASRAELIASELHPDGTLADSAVDRIARQLEQVRVTSHAVRHLSMVDSLASAVSMIGGRVTGIGPNRVVHLELVGGDKIVAQPTIGVPTSITLHEAYDRALGQAAAVVYDHVGIRPSWQDHIRWLGTQVPKVRWIKSTEAAWELAGWGAR